MPFCGGVPKQCDISTFTKKRTKNGRIEDLMPISRAHKKRMQMNQKEPKARGPCKRPTCHFFFIFSQKKQEKNETQPFSEHFST